MTDPYTAAWLAEMWPTCRELPRAEREAERELHRIPPAVEKRVDDEPRRAVS